MTTTRYPVQPCTLSIEGMDVVVDEKLYGALESWARMSLPFERKVQVIAVVRRVRELEQRVELLEKRAAEQKQELERFLRDRFGT